MKHSKKIKKFLSKEVADFVKVYWKSELARRGNSIDKGKQRAVKTQTKNGRKITSMGDPMIEALGRSSSQRISRIVDTPVNLSYGEIVEYIAGYEFGWQKWRWEREYCALIHLDDERAQIGLTKKYETGNLDPDELVSLEYGDALIFKAAELFQGRLPLKKNMLQVHLMYVPQDTLLDDLDKRQVWGDWYETRRKEVAKAKQIYGKMLKTTDCYKKLCKSVILEELREWCDEQESWSQLSGSSFMHKPAPSFMLKDPFIADLVERGWKEAIIMKSYPHSYYHFHI